mgnify:CR=1 FL=1
MRELHTPLCDLLGIRYPVVLAGMGGLYGRLTPPELVAAVSNAGGMGEGGMTDVEPEEIRRRIRRIRELTDKPFGIDLLLPATMDEGEPQSIEDMWQRILRDYPAHVKFVRDLIGEFGLPAAPPANDWFMSPKLLNEQAQAVLEEKVPVFAVGLGNPGLILARAANRINRPATN